MRQPLRVTNDLQRSLGCDGVTLESAFLDARASGATVLVQRVDPARSPLTTATPVVKFSRSQDAIPDAKCLKLATPGHYRKYEGGEGDIRDDMEARYREDVRSVFAKTGSLELSRMPGLSGSVTYGVDGFWVYCTSVRPTSTGEQERLRRRFQSDCATTIADPSAFARELGASFAAHSSWSDVELSFLDWLAIRLLPHECGDKVVHVHHGPVYYSDEPVELVESFPMEHRPTVVPFIKRRMYSWQQEYRFTVSMHGSPKKDELFLPISPELRKLASIEEVGLFAADWPTPQFVGGVGWRAAHVAEGWPSG